MEQQRNLVTLGQFLRQRRKQLGLTQTELGARLGWTQERVSLLEHGKYGMPSLPQLCRLAAALGVSLEELLRQLGVDAGQGPVPDRNGLPSLAQPRISSRLGVIVDQMRVVEERLHDAEDQILAMERLRASIREQRQRMGTLLASCREV